MAEQPSLAMPTSRSDEVAAKLALVRGLLERRGLPAIVLNEPGPVAWLSGGAHEPDRAGQPGEPALARRRRRTRGRRSPRTSSSRGSRPSRACPSSGSSCTSRRGTSAAASSASPRISPARLGSADRRARAWLSTTTSSSLRAARCPLRRRRSACRSSARDAASALESALRAWRPGELDFDVPGESGRAPRAGRGLRRVSDRRRRRAGRAVQASASRPASRCTGW